MEDLSSMARQSQVHKITVTNRRMCALSGVTEVISFDVHEIILETEQGKLQIKGDDLHINRLMLDKGEVDLDGRVDGFFYSAQTKEKEKQESLLAKLFK